MKRLLLVDDDESNRITLSALLEDEGFEVDVAASFNEARQQVASGGGAYHLALVDLHLRDGLGSDLVPLLRERQPAPKVVIMSGTVEADAVLPGNADGSFLKGEDFGGLLATLNRLLV